MIWNFLKTTILFAVLTGILLAASYAIGISPLLAIGLAAFLNLGIYWFSDRIVLAITRAKRVSEVEQPELHEIVKRLASSAGLPTPSIAVVESSVPNAFATGRSSSHATIAVHSSLLNTLNKDELEGVLAHEMTHVKNYDTLTSVVVATVAGAITYLGQFGWFLTPAYGYGGHRNRDSGMGAILAIFLAPVAALLVQMAISRTREFAADEGGAKLSRKPLALASALEKIEKSVTHRRTNGNPAFSQLYIVNPFRGSSLVELFSTHPPTWKRIARLQRFVSRIS
jgi:heat shock protein HtpX